MNKFLRYLTLVLFVSLLVVSCSRSPQATDMIPKDANVVISLDTKSLMEKGKLDQFKNTSMYSTMKKFSAKDPNTEKLLDQIIENPVAVGVDLTKDIYYFLSANKSYNCAMIGLSSSAKFEEFTKKIHKDLSVNAQIKKESKFSYVLYEPGALLLWDESKLIFIGITKPECQDSALIYANNLFAMKSENAIASNKDFVAFMKTKKDVNLWMSMEVFQNIIPNMNYEEMAGYKLAGNYIYGSLDFAAGQAAATINMSLTEEAKKVTFDSTMKNGISEKLMNFIPEKRVIAALSYSIDPKKSYEKIAKMQKSSSMLSMLLSKVPSADLEKIFNFINGEMLLTFNGFKVNMSVDPNYHSGQPSSIPLFSFVAGINDETKLGELLSLIKNDEIKVVETPTGYKFNLGTTDLSLLIKDKVMLLSNDDQIINSFNNGTTEPSFLATPFGEKIRKMPMVFYMNLKAQNYPDDFKGFLASLFSNPADMNIFYDFMANYDYILSYTESANSTKGAMILKFAGEKDNSLFTLISSIDKIVKAKTNF